MVSHCYAFNDLMEEYIIKNEGIREFLAGIFDIMIQGSFIHLANLEL
jgi:hypothetical protein